MFKYFSFFTIVFVLISCSDNRRDVNLQQDIKKDTSISSKSNMILFADPIIVDSSGLIAYPLILNKFHYSGSYSSGRGESNSY